MWNRRGRKTQMNGICRKRQQIFDLHVHTSAVSACGKVLPEDVTGLYAAAGFTGIVITEHFHKEYFDSLGELPWQMKIDHYLEGYRRAKNNSHGLSIYLGMEFRNTSTDDDFLVIGLSEKFLYDNPETYLLPWEQAFDLFHKNDAVIIQAHPCRIKLIHYREGRIYKGFKSIEMQRQLMENPQTPIMDWKEGMQKIFDEDVEAFKNPVFLKACNLQCPEQLDGIEVFNGNLNWSQNLREINMICKKYPHLVQISASDFHEISHCARGGVSLPYIPQNEKELAVMIKEGKISGLIHAYA